MRSDIDGRWRAAGNGSCDRSRRCRRDRGILAGSKFGKQLYDWLALVVSDTQHRGTRIVFNTESADLCQPSFYRSGIVDLYSEGHLSEHGAADQSHTGMVGDILAAVALAGDLRHGLIVHDLNLRVCDRVLDVLRLLEVHARAIESLKCAGSEVRR